MHGAPTIGLKIINKYVHEFSPTSCSRIIIKINYNFLSSRLPPRMKNICLSLLKTIQEFDDVITAAEEPKGNINF